MSTCPSFEGLVKEGSERDWGREIARVRHGKGQTGRASPAFANTGLSELVFDDSGEGLGVEEGGLHFLAEGFH